MSQRRLSGKPRPRCELVLEGRAEQIEHEVDARPALGDVILEIGKQPFVAEVHLGSEGDQQGIDVQAQGDNIQIGEMADDLIARQTSEITRMRDMR